MGKTQQSGNFFFPDDDFSRLGGGQVCEWGQHENLKTKKREGEREGDVAACAHACREREGESQDHFIDLCHWWGPQQLGAWLDTFEGNRRESIICRLLMRENPIFGGNILIPSCACYMQ